MSDIDKFLKRIKRIESSNGKDLDHKIMESGIHEGESATGSYGLMPNTIREFINRRKALQEYGPDDALMDKMDTEHLQDFVKSDPRVEENLAHDVAERVLSKSHGDQDKAAYMWNMGHNKNPIDISDEDLEESPYVRKFQGLRDYLAKK